MVFTRTMMMIDNRAKQTFLKNVIKQDGCWAYKGFKNQDGYHSVVIERNNVRRYYTAHRIMAHIAGMDIEDKLVCHHCDNPGCINPEHLFVGTPADNMADKVAKGRQAKGPEHQRKTKVGIEAKGGMKVCRGY